MGKPSGKAVAPLDRGRRLPSEPNAVTPPIAPVLYVGTMSLESLIAASGQQAVITAEAPDGQVPAQDALGGADRSDANWVTVASGVPCLVSTRSSTLQAFGSGRNDSRANVIDARIYFLADPVPGVGISSRHRITVTQAGPGGPRSLGVYAVQGSIDPNSMGRIIQVDCERVRTP